jgi:hypothetical protein
VDYANLDEFLKDHHNAILVAVAARMRGDEDMANVATRRGLSEADVSGQVLGFWLQGIRSDLTLGSTAAMEQNMKWLKSFRSGHDLPFDGKTVQRCFAEISDEIRSRLEAPDLRAEYCIYETQVGGIIAASFPEQL